MFTGLVQCLGRIERAETRGGETRFRIRPLGTFEEVRLGESIAVNGVCLTVETWTGGAFTAYASAETLSRSNLGGLRAGSEANLERALAMGDRLGGHMVSGHVDCLAEVASTAPAGESTVYTLSFPKEQAPFVIPKGSVALDGISLTVNECTATSLSVNIIPETQKATTIRSWTPGTAVNMETDLIGKYVARMVGPWAGGGSGAGRGGGGGKPGGLGEEFFRRHGF